MCVTSAVLDYGRQVPYQQWTYPGWYEYQELLRKARLWDEHMAQPHCEDPNKETWMAEVERRLKELERIP